MFVRRKKNKSGSMSVQIISKQHGQYSVIQTVGCSKDPDAIAKLALIARDIIVNPEHQRRLSSLTSRDGLVIENFLEQMTNSDVHTIGPELIFGILFDKIGLNVIPDKLFRHIVITRLAHPTSKLKTEESDLFSPIQKKN